MIFIGIDSGTQSTKALALDAETGEILASSQETYDILQGLPNGHLEQNPSDWIDAVRSVITSCVTALGERKSEVRGIGVSGQQHGLVVLDENDEVIRPAKLWCDTSTVQQCEQFTRDFDGDAGLIEVSGNTVLPGYTVPKILWMKQTEPENFARIKTILLPHDYINFWLTGIKRMEYGDASGTGMLDVRKREWCDEIIKYVDPSLREMLPPLGPSTDPHGPLRSSLMNEWGLAEEVIVSAGGGDNMMGAIGTGNVEPGIITASFGTSGTLYGFSEVPAIDAGAEVAAFCDSTDHWLPLVCTMNVTVVTEQVRELFNMDIESLEESVSLTEPGAGGLCFLPYLNGERTPNLPNGTGVLHGIRTDNLTQGNLTRAAMEGATLGLAYGLNRFRSMGLEPSEIRLTGGGSKSSQWRQIAADVFDVPVVPLATAEGAGLGAAIQAIKCYEGGETAYSGLCDKYVELDESKRSIPKDDNVSVYKELLERLTKLTKDLGKAGHI